MSRAYLDFFVPFTFLQMISKMKTMTCRQLGGACDLKFHADTFEEMAEQSKKHGMKMFNEGDESHIKAMSNMQKLILSFCSLLSRLFLIRVVPLTGLEHAIQRPLARSSISFYGH